MTLGISVYVWVAEMHPLLDIQVLIMLVVLTTKSLLRGTFSKVWEVPYLRFQECVALFTLEVDIVAMSEAC